LLACCLYASPSGAGPLAWDQFGFVNPNSASNTTAHAGGTVTVTTASLIEVGGCGCGPFLTDSIRYPNIDEINFNLLVVTPTAAQTGSPYTVTFDFTGTTLDSGGAINVGGIAGPLTTFTVTAFGPDDATPFPLTNLHFEQHVITLADNGVLSWNPATGVLMSPSTTAQSQFGFLSPLSGEIGRIVFAATTQVIATNGDQLYFGVGHAVPEPGSARLVVVAWALLGARRLRRSPRAGWAGGTSA
jgi:hypothetical protein